MNTEWTQDFDYLWLETQGSGHEGQEYTPGKEGRFRLKGRCRRCWGGLIGNGAAEHVPTVIRCRVCGVQLKGNAAREEYQRMLEQSASNAFNMDFGASFKYRDDATFVQKVFPHIDRLAGDELCKGTRTAPSSRSSSGGGRSPLRGMLRAGKAE